VGGKKVQQVTIRVHLPFPPSCNGLYPGTVRRHKSKEYEAWIIEAKRMLTQQHFTSITAKHPLQITITLSRPDKRVRDDQNYAKAPVDFLVSIGVIPDDRYVGRTITEWGDMVGKPIESGIDVEIIRL
jgi:Holliday junction resolvase RusA-like endonuclease